MQITAKKDTKNYGKQQESTKQLQP